ncbi:MAG: zinc ribbon domain-containing protein [Methanomassiliicoccales archaeon]
MRNRDVLYGAILAVAGLAVTVVSVLFVQQTGDWPPKEVLPEWLTYVGLGVMVGGIAWAAYGYITDRPKKVKTESVVEQKPAPAPAASTGNHYWNKEGSVPCPACGEPVKPGYARCPKCTALVTRECPSCKEKLPADFKACPKCGQIFDK